MHYQASTSGFHKLFVVLDTGLYYWTIHCLDHRGSSASGLFPQDEGLIAQVMSSINYSDYVLININRDVLELCVRLQL